MYYVLDMSVLPALVVVETKDKLAAVQTMDAYKASTGHEVVLAQAVKTSTPS